MSFWKNAAAAVGRGLLAASEAPTTATSTAVALRSNDTGGGESLENPNVPLENIFQVEQTWSGKVVTENSALTLAPVWRCVNLIAGWVARTPFQVYKRTDKGKEQATDHYLWPLLHLSANPYTTSYRFRRMMQTWLLLWGNAYAEIEINGRGQITALWPWRPDRVRIFGSPGSLVYMYEDLNGNRTTLPQDYILHLRGLETDGVMGLSPIRAARQSLGLGMAAEEYGARFFANSGKPGGWLEHPDKLGPDARKNLRESIEDIHRGLRGAHRIAIFEEGMKYHDVGVSPEDMQFLQTRQFQAIDIARIYGVPPHKIAELARATFSNIEHQSIEFFNDCLGDWFANWEAELTHSLLSARETDTVFLEFLSAYLLKGDQKARYFAYNIGRAGGWLSRNDIRDAESMNRIEGGDDYLTPLNMTDLAAVPDPETDEPADPEDPAGDPAAAAAAKRKAAKKKAALLAGSDGKGGNNGEV